MRRDGICVPELVLTATQSERQSAMFNAALGEDVESVRPMS